jgi:hypothetical protein
MVKPSKTMQQLEGQGGGAAGAWPQPQGEYEFSDTENRVIGKCGLWATILAIVMFVEAGVELINSQNILLVAAYVVTGVFYLLGGKALKGVVKTQGSDVSLMMSALKKLRVAFTIRVIVTAITAALILTILIVVLVVVVAVGSSIESAPY